MCVSALLYCCWNAHYFLHLFKQPQLFLWIFFEYFQVQHSVEILGSSFYAVALLPTQLIPFVLISHRLGSNSFAHLFIVRLYEWQNEVCKILRSAESIISRSTGWMGLIGTFTDSVWQRLVGDNFGARFHRLKEGACMPCVACSCSVSIYIYIDFIIYICFVLLLEYPLFRFKSSWVGRIYQQFSWTFHERRQYV